MVPNNVERALELISANADLNAFAEVYGKPQYDEEVPVTALLYGMPVAVKDNICVKGQLCCCASRVLEGHRAAYDAEAVARLKKNGAFIVGRTNMDEFAMGSSTETSVYGAVRCPHNKRLVAGGSSGGSAAAVGAGLVPAALGSDTGGSVRLPSAFCGAIGLRPSYGLVSRRGLVAFCSSLDTIGISACSASVCLKVLFSIMGHDPGDMTIDAAAIEHVRTEAGSLLKLWTECENNGIANGDNNCNDRLCLAVPEEWEQFAEPEVKAYFYEALQALKEHFPVKTVCFPYYEEALEVYSIIASAECYSNLSRYDGIRYGARGSGEKWLDSINSVRELFGPEVKRRLEKGAHILASPGLFNKALKARKRISACLHALLEEADFLLTPTAPRLPFAPGALSDKEMKNCDIYAIPASLASLPAMSLPMFISHTAPGTMCGLHLTAKRSEDAKLLFFADFAGKKLKL